MCRLYTVFGEKGKALSSDFIEQDSQLICCPYSTFAYDIEF